MAAITTSILVFGLPPDIDDSSAICTLTSHFKQPAISGNSPIEYVSLVPPVDDLADIQSDDRKVFIVKFASQHTVFQCDPSLYVVQFEDDRRTRVTVQPCNVAIEERTKQLIDQNRGPGTLSVPADTLQVSRWSEHFPKLYNKDGCKEIGCMTYNIATKIASTNTGTKVFIGRLANGEIIAIKRISTDNIDMELEIFETLKPIKMPHVLKCICYEQDDEFTYLASPLCEYSLYEVIEEKQFYQTLTTMDRVRLCIEFLTGLKELHDIDIIHRDIKPQNVLIDGYGKLMLSDFGVSRQLMGKSTLVTNVKVGTFCWMSKESMESDSVIRYNKSSDIQVAGSLLYYILSDGHIPHEKSHPYHIDSMGTMQNIREGRFSVEHLSKMKFLQDIIRDMISHEQQSRPRVSDCLKNIQAYVNDPACSHQKKIIALKKIGRWTELIPKLTEQKGRKEFGSLMYNTACKIAHGSTGTTVYIGELDNELVAVKRMSTDNIDTELEMFETLKPVNMSHAHKCICYEQDDEFTYFASPLCAYNLYEVIEEKLWPEFYQTLTTTERVRLCIEFLTGLQELHDIDIIHRDIKPQNVLIDGDGKLMLSDFGVSRQLMGKSTLVTHSKVGSFCWMSRESLGDGDVRYNKSSDIQVAGSLLYYILSDGHIPHEKSVPYYSDTMGTMQNIREGNFSVKHLSTMTFLRDIIRDMISHEQQSRPSVNDCLKIFQAYFNGTATPYHGERDYSAIEKDRPSHGSTGQPLPMQSQEEENFSSEDGEEVYELQVTGFKEETRIDTIEMYFGNKRKSGGSDVISAELKEPGKLIITYGNPEVIKQVLSRTHVLGGVSLTVKEPPKKKAKRLPRDRRCLVLKGLADDTSKENIENYLASRTRIEEDPEFVFGEEPGTVLVRYEHDITDFESALQRIVERTLNGARLTVVPVHISGPESS